MKYWLILLGLLGLNACAQTPITETEHSINTPVIEGSEVRNIRSVAPGLFAGGQPSEEQIDFLALNGVKHIVNLRPQTEQGFDESLLVIEAGMRYHALPVASSNDISVENALRLRAILADIENEATLVHCASGNRVGALMAIGAYVIDGTSLEQSLDIGRSWGLTRLEGRVIEVISGYDEAAGP